MIRIPNDFATAAVTRAGDAGRTWIADLPHLIAALCEEWRLVVDGAPMHGHLGLVVPARRGDEVCVLKLSWPDGSTVHEARALAAWNGHGAVRLLAAHADRGALLLERLDSRQSLNQLDVNEAVPIAGHLLRRLAVPAPDGVPFLKEWAKHMANTLLPRWEQLGRPLPHRLLDLTLGLIDHLGASTGDLLVHADLHYGNVLAGTRESWLAIDPKVVVGDPEFGIAPLVLRRFDSITQRRDLHHRLHVLANHAALDPQRTQAWTIVRSVDYWLWGLSIGLTEDPAICETITTWLVE